MVHKAIGMEAAGSGWRTVEAINANLKKIRGPSVGHLVTENQALVLLGCDRVALADRVAEGSVARYRIGSQIRYDLDAEPLPAPERAPRSWHSPQEESLLDAMSQCGHEEQCDFDPSWPLVYVVQAGSSFKIGSTRSLTGLRSRLKTMQVASPEPLFVRRLLRGTVELERQLHKRFAQSHVRGEWFRSTPSLLRFALLEGS